MAKILVTGGAGFLGTNLVKRLLAEEHSVTVLDNLYTGSKRNLEQLNVTFLEQDVRQPLTGTYDWIFSLACPASPPHYQRDPLFTLTTSIEGIRNVLELARATGARVLHASTSEVYGDPLVHPQPETYWGHVNTLGIRSCYDEGKRVAETMALEYHRAYGVDIRLVRIFNTYGPFMDPKDGRVVSNFILQALRNQNITLYGDGEQTRSFQYVDDLVEGFMRYIQLDPMTCAEFFKHKQILLPVLNLGNPGEFTMRQLAETVLALLPESTSKMTVEALPKDDPKRRKPDNAWAHELLDWAPQIPLAEGLVHTINYFRALA
ncbi:MAG: UDP-glucuronic acid decarboxylase family protein [Kiritimatiellia bacterium]